MICCCDSKSPAKASLLNGFQHQQQIKSDTCFYLLKVPANLDVPTTPHFDTTIVKISNCSIHILRLPSWGTETEYTLTVKEGEKYKSRSAQFFSGHYGMIDITNLPAGVYGMGLSACGNGGGFTIRIE